MIINGSGQSGSANTDQMLTLDNYLIPVGVKGAKIAKVVVPESCNCDAEVAIVKDTAGIFTIDSKGGISLKKSVTLKTDSGPFVYGITIKAGCLQKEFELVKDQFIKNKVIAHRGAWKNHEASQNSRNSLKYAIEIGCEASELDVWMTSDGAIVLNHDPEIDGKIIEDNTVATMTSVPLKGNDFLPTLEQIIKDVKQQNRTKLVIEIKASLKSQERTNELTAKVVKLVHDMKAQAWVACYISFNYDACLLVTQIDPTARTAYLGDDKSIEELKSVNMWGIDFNYKMFEKDPGLIQKAHNAGMTVNVWTVNKKEDLISFLDKGVDFITTNEPEMLLEIIKERSSK
ncbi:MAG: glycerophosphodiester phosphodiesterase family protein [Rikenellaceae bacterium]|jgi:glycerophosphoryl diester phosphodiesterase|nr:hypothetical protein [Bacteroidales bacterium]